MWDLDLDNHHPACPGGCGQLADECACRAIDYAIPCRWRGCRDDAERYGLCDVHLSTL